VITTAEKKNAPRPARTESHNSVRNTLVPTLPQITVRPECRIFSTSTTCRLPKRATAGSRARNQGADVTLVKIGNVIVTDLGGEPAFVLDSHHFLRDALFKHPDKIQGAC
jgi:hypothetical protein